MKKTVRVAALIMLVWLALLLSGCSPRTDTTDPLSDYSVDVNVPFATKTSAASTASATSAAYTISTQSSTKIVGWMNEALDSSEQNAYSELSLGSIGTAVKNLQKRLIELGYMTGTASGSFDQATALAVKQFETAYGRAQTGVATQIMQVYLFSDNAKTYTGISATNTPSGYQGNYSQLERGDTGSAVTRLQNRLIELGYLSSTANGVFDANTENAVKNFETAYGRQRTGIATVSLQTMVFSASAFRAGVTATPTPWSPTPTPSPTVAPTYGALQYGSKGDRVSELQTRLKLLGYYSGKVDGVYGNATVRAIQAFEAAYGQNKTGIASSALQSVLFSSGARAYSDDPTPTPAVTAQVYATLSVGSYGSEVALLQSRLIELGYLSGKADGYYGNATESAVRAFEARYGRTQSGVATAALQTYLFAADALSYSSTTQTQTEYAVLSEGSYGASVYALQNRLIALGYMSGSADGYYGASTASAIAAFEAAYNRTQTGIASVLLQETLYSDDAIAAQVTTPVDGDYKRLKKGDKGTDVAKLQLRLIELGYLSGTVDGYYGDGTADAVRAFEAAYGKTGTGIATSALQSYLFSDSAFANPNGEVAVSYSTLEKGDSGDAVRTLQARLIALGYLSGAADGQFGSSTVSAVKAFQKALELKQTGVASAALQKELYSSTAPSQDAQSAEGITVVNQTAYVSSAMAYVYASAGDDSPIGTLSAGAQVKLLRIYGEWAEIQNSSGNIGYALLADFTVGGAAETAPDTGLDGTVLNVKASAAVNTDQIIVYASPSESSEMLGTLSSGAIVTWNRTNGSWAEVVNSGGNTGYVYARYLTLVEAAATDTEQSSGGNDDAARETYTALKSGNTGEAVKRLQRRLKELGYFNGDIGGNYLTKTTAAVKAFQAAIAMAQTGEATVALQEILFSDSAPASGSSSPKNTYSYQTLTIGSTGADVGEMQLRLIALGFLDASETTFATFDAATRSALIDAQLAMGIGGADGVATPEILAYLASDASSAIAR